MFKINVFSNLFLKLCSYINKFYVNCQAFFFDLKCNDSARGYSIIERATLQILQGLVKLRIFYNQNRHNTIAVNFFNDKLVNPILNLLFLFGNRTDKIKNKTAQAFITFIIGQV